MRAKSHHHLGKLLAEQYLPDAPKRYILAFLIGCTEPDKNPATYLKGSLRSQWLRGHNWNNSQRYMQRICSRLERREELKLLDFYTLGKLMHYTLDAFTSAHNDAFPSDLQSHRHYESRLQQYFLSCLEEARIAQPQIHDRVMDTIRAYHTEYMRIPSSVHTDTQFGIGVASLVMDMLTAKEPSLVPAPGL